MSVAQGLGMAVVPDVSALSGLSFRTRDTWAPLPEWARYLTRLGALFQQSNSPGSRAAVCVTLPTRAFSAPFVALGAVAASVGKSDGATSASAHFEALTQLPVGTSVVLRKKNQKLKGIFLGPEERAGMRYVKVQVGSWHERGGGLTEFIREIDALRVHPLETAIGESALPKNQKGRPVSRHAPFLESLLGLKDVYEFVTRTSLACALIGSKAGLHSEIYDPGFAVGSQSDRKEGCLQAALRVREFLAEGDSHRVVMLSASAADIHVDPHVKSAPLAIFDGATAYLRWRQEFGAANSVVLLDRCQQRSEDAAAAFIHEHAKRLDDFIISDEAPRGVEVAAFLGKPR